MISRALLGFAAMLCALNAGAASAQEGGLIIDRDRADRRAPNADVRRQRARAPRQVAVTPANVPSFVLRGVDVDGSSLPNAALNAATANLIGRNFDGASLQQIADAVARAYEQGPVALYAVEIPAQDFSGGRVRVHVNEGHVSAVSLSGDTSGNIDLVRHYAAALTTERPLSRARMERELSLISDVPGLKTEVSMAPASDPGGVRVGLDLQREPWTYDLTINNRGSASLGRAQWQAGVTRNGWLRLGDQTRATLSSDADFERFWFASLSHRQPIGFDGAGILASISKLETEPEGGVRGAATAGSIQLSYPLIRSYRRNLVLSGGLDGLDSDNAELGSVTATERTRVLRASAGYSDAGAKRTLIAGATLSQGLESLGARASDPAIALDFTKLNLQLSYTRSLGRSFLVQLSAAGQASGDALPASERFVLGGAAFGRGFDAAATSGDDGVGASAELTWRSGRRLPSEAYVFADGGHVWIVDRPGFAGFDQDLASAGIGARFDINHKTRLEIEAAKPIDEPIDGAETGGWRFRFGLGAEF